MTHGKCGRCLDLTMEKEIDDGEGGMCEEREKESGSDVGLDG
jgi:hypothetical protein